MCLISKGRRCLPLRVKDCKGRKDSREIPWPIVGQTWRFPESVAKGWVPGQTARTAFAAASTAPVERFA